MSTKSGFLSSIPNIPNRLVNDIEGFDAAISVIQQNYDNAKKSAWQNTRDENLRQANARLKTVNDLISRVQKAKNDLQPFLQATVSSIRSQAQSLMNAVNSAESTINTLRTNLQSYIAAQQAAQYSR